MLRFPALACALLALNVCACDTDDAPPDCGLAEADCAALADARSDLEADYDGLLAQERYDELPPVGACVEDAVTRQFDAPDACGLNRCAEICRLHPCDPPAPEDCAQRCEEEASRLGMTEADLDLVLQAAARKPNLCTCDVCSNDDFEFCFAMWECTTG